MIHVLCGIPGSGKTTLARKLAEQSGAKIHSIDDVPGAWGKTDMDGKLRRQWVENIRSDLKNGISVVCDSTALTSHSRKWLLKELSEFDCKKVLIVKAVPLEVCLERNKGREHEVPEHQIKMAVQVMEAPTKDEGWDAIYLSRE